MFRLADLGQVTWPVQIGDAEFRVVFDVLNRKELQARQKIGVEAVAAKIAEDGAPRTTEALIEALEVTHAREDALEGELLVRVKGWYDVEDQDGNPLPFSTEHLQALLAHEYIYKAFVTALFMASRAGPQKNSLPGPGGMPERVQG